MGEKDDLFSMDDLPEFENLSLDELEALVKGRRLTRDLSNYLGNAHRVLNVNRLMTSDEPGSACAGYISLEPPPQEAIDLGRELAKRYGW